jgi:hypothetical protein
VSFIYLFRGEAAVLFFPQLDRCETGPSLKRFARRGGHPGRGAPLSRAATATMFS